MYVCYQHNNFYFQRWNHHRVSKSEIDKPILTDVTDNPYFSCCARCGKDKIYELETICQECGYNLGPATLSITYRDNEKHIIDSSENFISGSYITYEFSFENLLGCRIQGDGPVLISEIIDQE